MTRASFLRLYSVQVITEHDRLVKVAVLTIKNQKGSKQPLRWSPRKWINIDQSSSKTRSIRKSSTPKAQSSTKYRDGGSSSKKWQIKVSKGFRSGFLFRRHFVLESMRLFQKAFDKTKNFKQNCNFLWHP